MFMRGKERREERGERREERAPVIRKERGRGEKKAISDTR